MTQPALIDDPEKVEIMLNQKLTHLQQAGATVDAINDALLAVWVKSCRRTAGPAETALALRGIADALLEEHTPGRAAEPNERSKTADDVAGAVPAVAETVAALRLRGFSLETACDALLVTAIDRMRQANGVRFVADVLDKTARTFRLGFPESTDTTQH